MLNFALTEFHEVHLPWHMRNSRPTYVSCLRSITMPGCDRQGQTRREAGAQSLRTSEGGGRVAESPRAGPKMGPERVGAQRGLEKCPKGDVTASRDGPKQGPGEAQTPPGGGARDAGTPGAAKRSFG